MQRFVDVSIAIESGAPSNPPGYEGLTQHRCCEPQSSTGRLLRSVCYAVGQRSAEHHAFGESGAGHASGLGGNLAVCWYPFVEAAEMPHILSKHQRQKELSMANIITVQPPNRITSASLASVGRSLPQPDIWTEAGQAIEMAHRSPLPFGWVARLLGVLCLAAMVKFLA